MSEDIKGKILFFSPNEEEASYFTDSLIYICDHNESGSLGLIFNRPLNLKLEDLLQGMKFQEITSITGNVFLGGPVRPGANATDTEAVASAVRHLHQVKRLLVPPVGPLGVTPEHARGDIRSRLIRAVLRPVPAAS